MMSKTSAYLKQSFAEYYSRHETIVPERFGRREWGFFFFDEQTMQRHLAFDRTAELHTFLTARAPRHAYYSSAYYRTPDKQPMAQKVEGWLGADLIFDLDDEHLSDMQGLTQREKLEKVKRVVKDKLLDDFLLGDFGFDPAQVRIVFSGGRGYHVHVFDPRVLTLEGPERREIVDYITGIGLDPGIIARKRVYEVRQYKSRSVARQSVTDLPAGTEGGWRGRMGRGIAKLLNEMEQMDADECLELLQSMKYKDKAVGRARAETIYAELFHGEIGKRGIDTIRNENVIEIFSTDQNRDIFLNLVREKVSVKMAGETDEPVTVDTKRLIRLPGSIHGKTGLKVVMVPLEQLDAFEPLTDAVAFDDRPVGVMVSGDIQFDLGGEHYDLKAGTLSLPRHAAIFLMCKGAAVLP